MMNHESELGGKCHRIFLNLTIVRNCKPKRVTSSSRENRDFECDDILLRDVCISSRSGLVNLKPRGNEKMKRLQTSLGFKSERANQSICECLAEINSTKLAR